MYGHAFGFMLYVTCNMLHAAFSSMGGATCRHCRLWNDRVQQFFPLDDVMNESGLLAYVAAAGSDVAHPSSRGFAAAAGVAQQRH